MTLAKLKDALACLDAAHAAATATYWAERQRILAEMHGLQQAAERLAFGARIHGWPAPVKNAVLSGVIPTRTCPRVGSVYHQLVRRGLVVDGRWTPLADKARAILHEQETP